MFEGRRAEYCLFESTCCAVKLPVFLLHKMTKSVYNLLALAHAAECEKVYFVVLKGGIWKFGKVCSICSVKERLPH